MVNSKDFNNTHGSYGSNNAILNDSHANMQFTGILKDMHAMMQFTLEYHASINRPNRSQPAISCKTGSKTVQLLHHWQINENGKTISTICDAFRNPRAIPHEQCSKPGWLTIMWR